MSVSAIPYFTIAHSGGTKIHRGPHSMRLYSYPTLPLGDMHVDVNQTIKYNVKSSILSSTVKYITCSKILIRLWSDESNVFKSH